MCTAPRLCVPHPERSRGVGSSSASLGEQTYEFGEQMYEFGEQIYEFGEQMYEFGEHMYEFGKLSLIYESTNYIGTKCYPTYQLECFQSKGENN